ncbi:SpoIID/LytB domain-containing protein [Mucisphaera sp.]|uniref:SpoIID/LytB domain-containing protein n=1 Tax=Mucisphaera sp. TaxID=2913024 RepID=UPI003D0FBB2E
MNRPTLAVAGMSLLGMVLVMLAAGCEGWEPLSPEDMRPLEPTHAEPVAPNRALAVPQQRHGPQVGALVREPVLRVRVVRGAESIRLPDRVGFEVGMVDGGGSLRVSRVLTGPLVIRRSSQGITVVDGSGLSTGLMGSKIGVRSANGQPVTLGTRSYPGLMTIAHAWRSEPSSDRLDAINHVPMETYLPGVLVGELYGNWEQATFRAQAIAARSYAIFGASTTAHRTYDLESTTASQVYTGQTSRERPLEAVAATRGQVLVYRGRVVPAFYSADSGGVAQSAWDAFGDVEPIAPLQGRLHYDIGASSPHARWGPIDRSLQQIAARIKGWGIAQDHAIGRMQGIVRIAVTDRGVGGRASEFTVVDLQGTAYTLRAEQFRQAANYARPDLPDLRSDERLKSSFVEVTVRGNRVAFTNGRGFGHGVGLSQWGAQDMAERGYDHDEILAFYYPQAEIQRAY